MNTSRLVASLSLFLFTLVSTGAWAAPDLRKEVNLANEFSTATAKAPGWRSVKTQAGLSVFERAPDKAKKINFGLLVLAIEEGPKTTDGVNWKQVRENIVAAAKAAGSQLSLTVGEAFTASPGLVGRRLSGTTKVGERTVTVEMVAIVAPNTLLTISSVGRTDDLGVADLATAVAQTARVAPKP